jgi:hypothetical protein
VVTKIDFGTVQATDKNLYCPRVLLVSTWTDARYGFVGMHTWLLIDWYTLMSLSICECVVRYVYYYTREAMYVCLYTHISMYIYMNIYISV